MQIWEYSEDIQNELEDFLKFTYNAMGLEYQPDGLQSDTRKIREIYFNNGGFFWVAKDKNSIVGSIALKMINLDKRIGEIKRYFVLPSVQNKGIGSMLMEQLIVRAQKSGLSKLRLDTMKNSTKALSIFRKFGFKEIEKYNDNDIAEIFMELDIS